MKRYAQLVLNCVLNPAVAKEWALFGIRNLTLDNEENQVEVVLLWESHSHTHTHTHSHTHVPSHVPHSQAHTPSLLLPLTQLGTPYRLWV